MPPRRLVFVTAALLIGVAAWFFLKAGRVFPHALPPSASALSRISGPPSSARENQNPKRGDRATAAATEPNPLAEQLNAPDGTIRRDLEVLDKVFVNFHTNFPRTGNPVGDNAEITAALTGANPLQFAFLPRNHPAINQAGELCDRWGTPFRFHQLGGMQMEIRSAGPDRKFGTADDAEFAPWPK